MSGVNKVIVLGRLGKDPELRYLPNGTAVCKVTLATSRKYVKSSTNEKVEETEWHRCSLWGKTAENANNYLRKGFMVYFEGYLKTSSYDKEGQKHYSTEIVVEKMDLQPNPRIEEGEKTEKSSSKPQQKSQKSGARNEGFNEPPDFEEPGFQNDGGDDDIPF